ncbi:MULTISPECIES: SMR family transporter [unclassified Variovorax]|uniref:DMT family transporter n=1 Tax=unclassified Variovorax TaxID=663243 RepID=UPI000837B176|nr:MULTISPECIES: SMR family transporter [unclassified Variovorax]PNG59562.1 4-amino-4-deoxy-L-arabinose-phosphoundecaprenol flippase subunit ArnF [Variovorax sp. B4]PNG60647.1 4-amino-4-deoxy-L-arabinose-phosphoundecaprenol flippase subunit ArnF [Variovorax sp. B2]VTV13456.1 4-amino-4-deoxy-L-arabinose-phosphoundecaprenol flippase subunit ArnF [Variovorax sp. WDL1]
MTFATFSIIFAGVLLNSAAQLMLKAGANTLGTVAVGNAASLLAAGWGAATQPWILLGLCCYFVSAGLWVLALTRVDVTVAYPLLSMGYVMAALLAWHFFGEALTASRILGIAIILVGVVVLGRG